MRQNGWYPIAASHELPFRHVFHAQLLGREFAVWRADDGYVNVWENRCLHRGVRLSIGVNDGRELKCQYHGWRYANRTGGCTYIPAHPADAPARTISNRTFPVVERYGLVWSSLDAVDEPPEIAALDHGTFLVLRAMPLNAAANKVIERLKRYQFQPSGSMTDTGAEVTLVAADHLSVVVQARLGRAETLAMFFVQPVDAARCIIRGVLDSEPDAKDRIAVLRQHNERLSALRDETEREAAMEPAAPAIEPIYEPVLPELAEMPAAATAGAAMLKVLVARKWAAAEAVAGFELHPLRGQLPTFQPGAHIDVHLPNGMVRQYSIVNAPGETDRYVIGVKREAQSRGGSQCLHEIVREGSLLAISEPRNNFPLRRDAKRTIFIAGGIGVTPLLTMALVLHHTGLRHEFHYFAKRREELAFPERLGVLGEAVTLHLDLSRQATVDRIGKLLTGYRPHTQLYVCGPPPMLDATRRVASELGWPETQVHFEYFKNERVIDNASRFSVALARSCVTLEVRPGQSILRALRESGISIASSCEQGACGTCIATVLEGKVDHQDVYLSDAEKGSGTKIITCVSRAKSERLVLDL